MDFLHRNALWIVAILVACLILLAGPRAILPAAIIAATVGLFWQARRKAGKPAENRRLEAAPARLLARPSLDQVDDPRLAAVILMIQLVHTGAPVTAAKKGAILDLMAQPLGIADRDRFYDVAWGLTERDRLFTAVADEVLPLLRARLSRPERQQLIDMLGQVADADGGASDLQREAIVRLKRRLLPPDAAAGPAQLK